jgi:chaperonin cofactor prefoldin
VSVLTKVFVVLLTLLSIALSMFVVAAFAQQENWRLSSESWRETALAANAKERTVTANAAIEQQRALDRHHQDVATIDTLQNNLAAANDELARLNQDNSDLENKLTVKEGQLTTANRLSSLLQAAFNREQESSTKLSRRNSELERRNVDLNSRVKELTANMAMATSRVRALKEQIASMSEDSAGGKVAQIPGGPGIVQAHTPSVSTGAAPSAMSSPIRAEVTKVNGNLASISVGSADGVAHGMKFLLYRPATNGGTPQYLGTLRVTRVETNQCAGSIEQIEGEVRPGDSARDEASFALRG